MARPPITWLIADTHFFHNTMVEKCGRPSDFTSRLIANLQQAMTTDDLLIHLGDCIFYQYNQLKGLLDSIPGRKVLIKGNHDKKGLHWYMNNGFDFATHMIVQGSILLSHYPIAVLPSGVTMNIHGHWHNKITTPRPTWWSPTTHKLLAVEYTDYKPVRLEAFANAV